MMDVSPEKLKEEKKKGTSMTIVDLQSERDYQHSHIPGAVNLPLEKFENEFAGLLKDKDQTIVLYGEYDELGKGAKAVEILAAAGYTKLGLVLGGLMGWKEAGYPTDGGRDS